MFDPTNSVHVADLNSSRFILTLMSDVEIQGHFRLIDMDLYTCNRPLWIRRLTPVINALVRIGWMDRERATPRNGEERQQTLSSICALYQEARAIIANAEQPYVWDGCKFAPTGPGASL